MASRILSTRERGAFAGNDHGNVAMIFALFCLAIFPVLGFTMDFARVVLDKQKLQLVSDAAALAAAHDPQMTVAERRSVVEAHLDRLEDELGREIVYTLSQTADGAITLTTQLRVDTTIAQIMGRDDVDITVESTAQDSGADIEVAMVLDITGSMSGTRIEALREAANELVEIVVEDRQTPYYSKVAVVPYSAAVNVGTYAPTVRGPIVAGRGITAATWQAGTSRTISGVTRAATATVTATGHGFSNGDRVWVSDVRGMAPLNGRVYTVAGATANAFALQGVNSSGFPAYTGGGTLRKCLNANCEVTVTANRHGLAENDHVVISGVRGMTQINTGPHATWQVSGVTTNTFMLNGSAGPNYGAYTSSGTSFCTVEGCEWLRFTNAAGAQRVNRISTCVTERIGDEAYTDASAAGDPVGRAYLATNNPCPDNRLVPLTSDKRALANAIDDLEAGGTTAGQIGASWGWYALSPTFGSIFPAASRPADYHRPKLHKFAVFMTDGEFNSAYCRSVLSRDSTAGSAQDKINCNAENGRAFTQAAETCRAMKAEGITVYSVGFEVANPGEARTFLTNCATSPQHAFFPTGSDELVEVFESIAQSITEVRLVH